MNKTILRHLISLAPLMAFPPLLSAGTPVDSELSPDHVQAAHHGHGDTHRHTEYAPIGVMGDHVHGAGEFMLSYRFMYMEMDGNRDGTSGVSANQVFRRGYMVAPTSMSMEMHMVGAMYAPTDALTLMAMLPHTRLSMDHVTRMGGRFTTESDGIGDFKLGALLAVLRSETHHIHLNLGVTAPTGSIDERDVTPMGPDQKLPYPMQLGSGTFDLLPGVTYLGQAGPWSWGAQLGGTIRMGTNDEGYSLGNRARATLWGAFRWTAFVSTSLRLDGQAWGDIDGADRDLNPSVVPTADPALRAGERIDLLFGVSLGGHGALEHHRLSVEAGLPVYQYLDGPQLETDFLVTAGYQFIW